jgi:hypothetical protein
MPRHHVDHAAVFDLIRKCTPRKESNLSNSSSIQNEIMRTNQIKFTGIGIKIIVQFLYRLPQSLCGRRRDGKTRKRGTIQLYTQTVCLLHSIHGRSQSIKYKQIFSGYKYTICLPIVRTYHPAYPPLVHTASASFNSKIQK